MKQPLIVFLLATLLMACPSNTPNPINPTTGTYPINSPKWQKLTANGWVNLTDSDYQVEVKLFDVYKKPAGTAQINIEANELKTNVPQGYYYADVTIKANGTLLGTATGTQLAIFPDIPPINLGIDPNITDFVLEIPTPLVHNTQGTAEIIPKSGEYRVLPDNVYTVVRLDYGNASIIGNDNKTIRATVGEPFQTNATSYTTYFYVGIRELHSADLVIYARVGQVVQK
jgi:hypothetical protein